MIASRALILLAGLTGVLATSMGKRAETLSFGYQGSDGPSFWPGFCQDTSPGQSPIDIRPGSADARGCKMEATLEPACGATLRDTGKGLEVQLPEGGPESTFVAYGQNETFSVKGFHFHTPSEHRFNGNYFDGEVHFVGKSPSGVTSVIGVMLEVSDEPIPNNVVSVVSELLPLEGESGELSRFDFSAIMEATDNLTGFHTYTGSLTTPPCTAGVLWHVMDKPLPISVKEFSALRRAQGYSSRYVQVTRDEVPAFTEPGKPAKKAKKSCRVHRS